MIMEVLSNLVSKVEFGLVVVAMLSKEYEESNYVGCIFYLNNKN
jgi:hypothetical protein